MPTKTKDEKKKAIEAAFDHVHTDVERLIKQAASENAVVNMGQSIEDWFPYFDPGPETLLERCFSNFYQSSESDEMAEGLEDERRAWVKTAKRDVAAVQKKKLPLTVRNVQDACFKRGAFAKKQ